MQNIYISEIVKLIFN